jgi:two-component system response regulator YesN
MMFLKRLQQYRVYRKLLLSYLLLVTITISVLCAILYSLFSAKAVNEIDQSSLEMLSQVSYTANVVFKQVEDITRQMLNDNQIVAFMYAKDDDKLVDYNASLLLTKVQTVYPFISNISLYNFSNGAYIDTASMPPDPSVADRQQSQYLGFYPRKIAQDNGPPLQLLTFTMMPEQSMAGASKSAIVLDLKESYIQNTMRSISASSGNASTFVLDAKGTVLSHSDSRKFMDNFSQQPYVQQILSGTGNQGSFVQTIDHKKQLVTYVKSTTLDWYFVSVRPYDQLLSNIYELRNWTLLIALFLIIAGAAISLLVTGNMYNPIKALVDKVTERGESAKAPLLRLDEYKLLSDAFTHTLETARTMESTLNRSSQMLKNSYMFHLLKGNADKSVFSPLSADIEQEWRNRLKGPYFAVLLFKIDAFRSFKETYNAFDRGLIRFAVGNIAQELLGKTCLNDIAMMEEDEIVFVVQTDRPAFDDHLFFILAEIQDTIHTYYKITVSVSIGDLCGSIADIRGSFLSAQTYMAERLFHGHGCLLDASRVKGRQEQPSRYPSSSERKLIDAIKLCQSKSIQKEIAGWIHYLSRSNHTQAIQYTNFLFLAIIREFENITEWWGVDPNDLYLAMNEIHYAETLDDIQKILTQFCFRIVAIIEENKNSAAAAKNAKVIEEVKRYLHAHYADPGLSLELAAEHVGLSSGYIGKLFKNVTGTSFNDYVTQIRMEKAKALLTETTNTVAQIGEHVGICNVSYFSTLFKKKYGMTPSQFREQA